MNTTYKLLAVVLLLLVVVGACRLLYNMFLNVVLESKDVQNFVVEQSPGVRPVKLTISGNPFFSGMVVRNITATRHDPVIVVSVHLATIGLVKARKEAGFRYELTVPDTVNEVRFGSNPKPIWTRGLGGNSGPG